MTEAVIENISSYQ